MSVLGQELLGVLVASQNVERVAVDLDVSADGQVRQVQERVVVVHVSVATSVQELALLNARVFLSRLINSNRVVGDVERDNKTAVDVFRHLCVQFGGEAQNHVCVVDALEKVHLWFLGHQSVHLTQSVLFVTESVVRRNLRGHLLRHSWKLNLSHGEIVAVSLGVEVLGESVDALNIVAASISVDGVSRGDLVGSEVVVPDHVLAGLVHSKAIRQALSLEQS